MFVRLKAKTQHGKNRIEQHGDVWEVVSISVRQQKMWLASLKATFRLSREHEKSKDCRWLHLNNDTDFEIVEVVK